MRLSMNYFCFIYSLQTGCVLLSTILLTLGLAILLHNLPYLDSNLGTYVLLFFLMLLFSTALFTYFAAFSETDVMARFALLLMVVTTMLWFTMSLMPFFADDSNARMILRDACIRYRCGESLWLMDMDFRRRIVNYDEMMTPLPLAPTSTTFNTRQTTTTTTTTTTPRDDNWWASFLMGGRVTLPTPPEAFPTQWVSWRQDREVMMAFPEDGYEGVSRLCWNRVRPMYRDTKWNFQIQRLTQDDQMRRLRLDDSAGGEGEARAGSGIVRGGVGGEGGGRAGRGGVGGGVDGEGGGRTESGKVGGGVGGGGGGSAVSGEVVGVVEVVGGGRAEREGVGGGVGGEGGGRAAREGVGVGVGGEGGGRAAREEVGVGVGGESGGRAGREGVGDGVGEEGGGRTAREGVGVVVGGEGGGRAGSGGVGGGVGGEGGGRAARGGVGAGVGGEGEGRSRSGEVEVGEGEDGEEGGGRAAREGVGGAVGEEGGGRSRRGEVEVGEGVVGGEGGGRARSEKMGGGIRRGRRRRSRRKVGGKSRGRAMRGELAGEGVGSGVEGESRGRGVGGKGGGRAGRGEARGKVIEGEVGGRGIRREGRGGSRREDGGRGIEGEGREKAVEGEVRGGVEGEGREKDSEGEGRGRAGSGEEVGGRRIEREGREGSRREVGGRGSEGEGREKAAKEEVGGGDGGEGRGRSWRAEVEEGGSLGEVGGRRIGREGRGGSMREVGGRGSEGEGGEKAVKEEVRRGDEGEGRGSLGEVGGRGVEREGRGRSRRGELGGRGIDGEGRGSDGIKEGGTEGTHISEKTHPVISGSYLGGINLDKEGFIDETTKSPTKFDTSINHKIHQDTLPPQDTSITLNRVNEIHVRVKRPKVSRHISKTDTEIYSIDDHSIIGDVGFTNGYDNPQTVVVLKENPRKTEEVLETRTTVLPEGNIDSFMITGHGTKVGTTVVVKEENSRKTEEVLKTGTTMFFEENIDISMVTGRGTKVGTTVVVQKGNPRTTEVLETGAVFSRDSIDSSMVTSPETTLVVLEENPRKTEVLETGAVFSRDNIDSSIVTSPETTVGTTLVVLEENPRKTEVLEVGASGFSEVNIDSFTVTSPKTTVGSDVWIPSDYESSEENIDTFMVTGLETTVRSDIWIPSDYDSESYGSGDDTEASTEVLSTEGDERISTAFNSYDSEGDEDMEREGVTVMIAPEYDYDSKFNDSGDTGVPSTEGDVIVSTEFNWYDLKGDHEEEGDEDMERVNKKENGRATRENDERKQWRGLMRRQEEGNIGDYVEPHREEKLKNSDELREEEKGKNAEEGEGTTEKYSNTRKAVLYPDYDYPQPFFDEDNLPTFVEESNNVDSTFKRHHRSRRIGSTSQVQDILSTPIIGDTQIEASISRKSQKDDALSIRTKVDNIERSLKPPERSSKTETDFRQNHVLPSSTLENPGTNGLNLENNLENTRINYATVTVKQLDQRRIGFEGEETSIDGILGDSSQVNYSENVVEKAVTRNGLDEVEIDQDVNEVRNKNVTEELRNKLENVQVHYNDLNKTAENISNHSNKFNKTSTNLTNHNDGVMGLEISLKNSDSIENRIDVNGDKFEENSTIVTGESSMITTDQNFRSTESDSDSKILRTILENNKVDNNFFEIPTNSEKSSGDYSTLIAIVMILCILGFFMFSCFVVYSYKEELKRAKSKRERLSSESGSRRERKDRGRSKEGRARDRSRPSGSREKPRELKRDRGRNESWENQRELKRARGRDDSRENERKLKRAKDKNEKANKRSSDSDSSEEV